MHVVRVGCWLVITSVSECRVIWYTHIARCTYLWWDVPGEPLGVVQWAVHVALTVAVLSVAQLEGICGQCELRRRRHMFIHNKTVQKHSLNISFISCLALDVEVQKNQGWSCVTATSDDTDSLYFSQQVQMKICWRCTFWRIYWHELWVEICSTVCINVCEWSGCKYISGLDGLH